MINFSAFEIAHRKYQPAEMPLLSELLKKVEQNKIYQGLNILHNTALTIEAVLKIEPLILGGANVTATCITLLPPQEEAIAILKAANVKLQLEHKFDEEYDVHLDCCGELVYVSPPRIGAVELTQTGSEVYKHAKLTYPAISVDESRVKLLETFFGTGDGFVRGLYEFAGEKIHGKSYVVFGFGKVSKGIVHALKKITAIIVTIIDIDVSAFDKNAYPNVQFINGNEREKVKEAIKKAYCIVTATGVEGVISKYYAFNKADFGESILANMGADDEYGQNFSADDVLFVKKPLNFSISEPTTMKYLDPVFYAHNLGIDILLSRKVQPGYNGFPSDLSTEILEKWQKIHQEDISILP